MANPDKKMTMGEVVKQLESLKDHCERCAEIAIGPEIWESDVFALDVAITIAKAVDDRLREEGDNS